MHEARYIVVMAEFMQVTPTTPMTGIEVATQERGTHYKNSWTMTMSVYLVHAFIILCNEFHFLPLCLTKHT